MIVSMWQLDPEFRIVQLLQKYLDESAIAETIPIRDSVTFGHPLYTLASRQGDERPSLDSYFPKIGAEWSSDTIEDDLGRNHDIRAFDSVLRNKISTYLNRDNEEDVKYEHYSHALLRRALEGSYKQVQSFTTHVVSEVLVSGWGGQGERGRKLSQDLYKCTMDVLPYIAHDIHAKYRATLEFTEDRPSPNVESPQFGRGVWGFEILMQIRQIKRTYRFTEQPLISKAKVNLHGTYGEGINFKPFVGDYSPKA